MSAERADSYVNRVVKILNEETLEPRDKALIMAGLAQVEATLEMVDRLKNGIPLAAGASDVLEMFSISADSLSRRLGDR